MENYHRSYDNLAHAAEAIFNRPVEEEIEPQPIPEEEAEAGNTEELEESSSDLIKSEEETLTEAVEHTFKVTAPNSKVYVIDGEENPTLELERGKSYVFELDASGHPFMIKNEKTGGEGDQYNDGVTNNGVEEGKIEIAVSADTPDELYYICSYHPLMCGILKIKG